jgi:hypothetical protein
MMRPLAAAELLQVWECGLGQPPLQQALLLLNAACPDTPLDLLARLSIGQRDSQLLTLREWTFGPRLVSIADCPACSERLELRFPVADIRVMAAERPEALSVRVREFTVEFRLPNSWDLAALAEHNTAALPQRVLYERCLLAARRDDVACSADELPSEVVEAVAEQMSRADPQADVRLALTCPACRHQWRSIFDIVTFFWIELDVWARRTLRDVHALARAYGWREADILALSPQRRQCYLEMISA